MLLVQRGGGRLLLWDLAPDVLEAVLVALPGGLFGAVASKMWQDGSGKGGGFGPEHWMGELAGIWILRSLVESVEVQLANKGCKVGMLEVSEEDHPRN